MSVEISGHHTDIVASEYENMFFLIITQYEKIGTLVSLAKCSPFMFCLIRLLI